jgi:hypothetical protein
MKKTFLEKITSKTFRKTAKTFIICMIILALFVYIFIKMVYYIKENVPAVKKPTIKENEGIIDTGRLVIKEGRVVAVGNISVT